MSKLWEPNPFYDESKPQWWDNMPYKRLYRNLTPEELLELLRDAKEHRWEVLDLCSCGLSSLPDTLGELEDLRFLNIGNFFISAHGDVNVFTKLPDSIGNLTGLKELNLSHSKISALPDFIGNLTGLKELILTQVKISALPDSIGNLKSLEVLALGGTLISELPNFEKLINLQKLYLWRTYISMLPDSIGDLACLQWLNLRECHLKAIPYSLVKLGLPFFIDSTPRDQSGNIKANGILLVGVTLDEGDISLFAQSREVIEAYYHERLYQEQHHHKQEAQSVNECKVIFLGDGAAGKSSLIERMVNGKFKPGSLPTDGVKMTKWKPPIDGNPYTLRFLDFGGQEIMHSMHRCFLTAHTVYVIVCESREDAEIDAIAARWLETVKAFAPDCPVILALNKCDVNPNVSVNERDLRERNPRLKCVLKTSAAVEPGHKFGVNHLLAEIMEEVPKCVSHIKEWNVLAVKEELENMTEDYISSESYRAICAKHHVDEETLQYKSLNYFKDLGVAYSYDPSKESDDIDTRLESIRVLNPAWLTNGIYRLILRTEENGFLPIKTIQKTLRATHPGDILRDKTYKKEETEFILHVMRKFEISHYIGGGVEMIPLKMPKTPPSTVDDFSKTNALHLRWEGAYLPNNLIHRLLIRKFDELDTKCVWRTGGHFVQEGGGCEALAEMNEKALNVYVNGQRDCRPYLETFRRVIQAILTDLNLKASEVICCTVDGQEGRIPYEDVVQQYYDKRDSIYIPGIRKYVNPAELLRDTYYHWEQEAARYRQRMDYGPVNIHITQNNSAKEDEPKEENPLEEEKTRSEIAQSVSEADKNRSETTLNRMKIGLIFAVLFIILISLLVGQWDKISEYCAPFLPLIGG